MFPSLTLRHFFAATLRISAAQVNRTADSALRAMVIMLSFSGGYLLYAWEYMANHGLASDVCIPYASGSGKPPACPSTCADNRTITRTAAMLSSVAYSGSAAQLQNEILKNGPIQVPRTMISFLGCCMQYAGFELMFKFQVGFDVYNDFFRLFSFLLFLFVLRRL
jgi:hypothetical protein